MANVVVNINVNKAMLAAGMARVDAMMPHLVREGGIAALEHVKRHLSQLGNSRGWYYKTAATRTELELKEGSHEVAIVTKMVGLRMHQLGTQGALGRPLQATGRTSEVTGRPIRALAIPTKNVLSDTSASSRTIFESGFEKEGDLKYIPVRSGNCVGLLVLPNESEGMSDSARRGRKKMRQRGHSTRRGEVMYVLVRQVVLAAQPEVYPKTAEIARAFAEGMKL